MRPRRRTALLMPMLVGLAFWPVVHWYALAMKYAARDSWELVALALAGGLVLVMRRPAMHGQRLLLPAALVTGLYGILSPWLPAEVESLFLATALALVVAPLWLGRRYSAGLHGLLLLAQPLVPVYQYQLGYPLRATCAQLAAGILRLGPLDVTARGTALEWAGRSVYVDAPCSGVRLLWSGMLLCFALALMLDLGPVRSVLLALFGFVGVLFANALRAAALFYLESGLVVGPAWTHAAIGIAIFACVGACLVLVTLRWGAASRTSEPRSTACAI